jgi:hypothetical protein
VRFVRTSAERSENVIDGNADMNAPRKSDGFVVPATPANNGGPRARGVGRGKGPSQEERLTGDHRAGLSAGPNAGQTARATCVKVFVPSTFTFDLRQEPYEVILHVRICAGGRRQRRSLPRYSLFMASSSECTRGQPRGRSVDVSPNRFALDATQSESPKGRPR